MTVLAAMDVYRSFLERAAEIALASKELGLRLLDTKRAIPSSRSANEQAPRPPEPETSRLVDAVGAIGPFFHRTSDQSLTPVREALLRVGQLVNECLPLQSYDFNQPLWVSGPAFFNEGSALEEAIRATPRTEPALWAKAEALSQGPEPQATVCFPSSSTPICAATANEPPSTMVSSAPLQSVRTEEHWEFFEFTVKQRALLKALYRKGHVSIASVKQAVYGTEHAETSALEQLKSRTNKKLAERNYPFEVKREANTFLLSDI
jgi:hypothetical protein